MTFEFKLMKICPSCGAIYKPGEPMPVTARPWIDEDELLGYIFECVCHSTLMVKEVQNKIIII